MSWVLTKEKRLHLLAEEKEWKALLLLSLPSVAGMVVVAFYNVVDAWFIGLLADTQAQAAVSIIFPLMSLFMAVGQMLGISGGAYLSRCLGMHDYPRAQATLANSLWSAIILSCLITFITLIGFSSFISLLGATPTNMAKATEYGRPLISMCFLTIFTMVANNFIRAEGNTFVSMFGIMLGGVANCILDPLFMFSGFPIFHSLGWHHSILGAAWATVISQLLSALYLARYMLSKEALVKIDLRKYSFDKSMFCEVGGIALATFCRQALIALSVICFNAMAKHYATYPDAMLASIGVVIRVTSLPFLVMIGFLQAFQPFAAYNYGAQAKQRLGNAIKIAKRGCLGVAFILCGLLFIFAPEVAGMFIRDTSHEGLFTLHLTTVFLRLFIITMPWLSSYLIYSTLFQAMGRVSEAILLSVARNGFFFIPFILILPFLLSLTSFTFLEITSSDWGIILVQPVADICSILLAAWVTRRKKLCWD